MPKSHEIDYSELAELRTAWHKSSMSIRRAFIESTYGQRLLATSQPQPLVWQWWLRVETAYKRMWPGAEMLEPPTGAPR